MTSDRGTVLAYHAIGDCHSDPHNLFVPVERFAGQMSYLARIHRVVPLDEVVRGTAPARSVALTFDDGYVSVFTEAAEILARHGFPATVFVPTAYIGGRNEWDPATDCPVEIADADMLRTASRSGIRIESHGHAHIDMTRCTADAARADLSTSVEVLRQIVGESPRYLAYPFSTAASEVRPVVRELGFEAAFTIDRPDEGVFARERVQVTPLDGPVMFAAKASGRYLSLRNSPAGRAAVRWTRGFRKRAAP